MSVWKIKEIVRELQKTIAKEIFNFSSQIFIFYVSDNLLLSVHVIRR